MLKKKVKTVGYLLILIIINLLTFKDHYFGNLSFPWDFLAGYHAHAYNWLNDLKNFNISTWVPWSDIGFPNSMAVQSGAWYLPLIIYNLFINNFNIHAAVVFQVLHVLFGAVGVYFLIKSLNYKSEIALVCGIAFHFTVGFYSNQQHIDIIRSYALLPWIIYFINPIILFKNFYNQIILFLFISQFLIAGYPGIIVSGFYTILVFFIFFISSETNKKNYLLTILFLSFIGILLSLIKWLPFFSNYDLINLERSNFLIRTDPQFLLSIFYSYTNDFFTGDLTMRGIYISSLAVILPILFFNKSKNNINILALCILLLFTIRIFVLPNFPVLMNIIPGLKLSRFPISDWRFTFYIGIILLLANSLEIIFEQLKIKVVNLLILLILITLLYFLSKHLGISSKDAANYLLKALLFIVFLFIVLLIQRKNNYKINFLLFYLVALFALDGFIYNNINAVAWKMTWNKSVELQLYSTNIPDKMINKIEVSRPERIYYGKNALEISIYHSSLFYNQCIYNKSYCLYGYNNLKLSKPHLHIKHVIDNDIEPTLFNFITSKQHLIEINQPIKNYLISDDFLTSENKNIIAKPILYSENKVIYYIKTPIESNFLENEIWWKGWTYKICNLKLECSNEQAAGQNKDYLRTFKVPAGEWKVIVEFKQAWLNFTYLLCAFTIFLLATFLLLKKKYKIL